MRIKRILTVLPGRCIKRKISNNKFNFPFALCSLSFARYISTLTQYCSSARYSPNYQKVDLATKKKIFTHSSFDLGYEQITIQFCRDPIQLFSFIYLPNRSQTYLLLSSSLNIISTNKSAFGRLFICYVYDLLCILRIDISNHFLQYSNVKLHSQCTTTGWLCS